MKFNRTLTKFHVDLRGGDHRVKTYHRKDTNLDFQSGHMLPMNSEGHVLLKRPAAPSRKWFSTMFSLQNLDH